MTDGTEGAKAIEAAVDAYEAEIASGRITYMSPMSAAIRAYLAALPGWRLVPVEANEIMATAGRAALREAGLLPAYTDEGKGPYPQPPIMAHMLKTACWPAMLHTAPNPPGLHSEDSER